MQLEMLRQLWAQTIGPPPMPEQFGLWSALHTEEVIRQAILRTARKNIDLDGTMSPEYKVRFASRVMIVQNERNTSHAANKQKLCQEMEAR